MSNSAPGSQSRDIKILRVAVPTPLRREFDYLPPKDGTPAGFLPGVRVSVPFGRGDKTGLLVAVVDSSDVPSDRLKRISDILDDKPVLSPELMSLLGWVSRYYQYPIGEVLFNALPVLLRQGKPAQQKPVEAWSLTSKGKEIDEKSLSRSPRQLGLLRRLQSSGSASAEALNTEQEGWRPAMKKMQEKGWVEKSQQSGLADPVSRGSLTALSQSASPGHNSGQASCATNKLNPAQQAAVDQLVNNKQGFAVYLLQGVTGSGKTEVYLEAIAHVLNAGKQALLMVPEIGLTPQLISRFRARFADVPVAVLHSGLTDQARLTAWMQARDGDARIVIGTRSAIVAPMPDLGIIVIDEEHDQSYKQQDRLRYSARDVAIRRAQQLGIPVLAGSATPSLESLSNTRQGRYTLLPLPDRAGAATHPDIGLIDVRGQNMQEGLSAQMLQSMRQHLAAGNQVLLFLNRRGFAPTHMCHECGWIAGCQRCDSHMTLYQSRSHLRCQHCGAERRMETACPDCNSSELIAVGQGTERIEQTLRQVFPDIDVLRIDRDTMRRKDAMQKVIDDVHSGKPCILIGTQMLAKGHDFPRVTLAGIVDADQGLFSADFRGTERMAQLLIQVAGRAGRAEQKGQVLIQTHHPENPLLQTLITQGYESFASTTLQERKDAGLPPFSHMALLRAEAVSRDLPLTFLLQAKQLAQSVIGEKSVGQVSLLGPVPAPMEKRAGRFRAQLLLQSSERAALQNLLTGWLPQLENHKAARKVRWSIDVDPLEMF